MHGHQGELAGRVRGCAVLVPETDLIAKAVGLEPVEQLHREDDVGGRAARLLDVFSSD